MPSMETIRARHSVRQYTDRAIEAETLARIQKLVEQTRLKSGLDVQLIQDNPEAFNVLMSFGAIHGASTLIAFVAKDKSSDRAIGYWGQKLVLELQDLGLNTCWVALFSKKKCKAVAPAGHRKRVVIAIGYGETNGIDRPTKSVAELSRIELADPASTPNWFPQVMEAAQLSPTAMNAQKFTVVLAEDGRTLSVEAPGTGYSTMDSGIVMANIELAANEAGADWQFIESSE